MVHRGSNTGARANNTILITRPPRRGARRTECVRSASLGAPRIHRCFLSQRQSSQQVVTSHLPSHHARPPTPIHRVPQLPFAVVPLLFTGAFSVQDGLHTKYDIPPPIPLHSMPFLPLSSTEVPLPPFTVVPLPFTGAFSVQDGLHGGSHVLPRRQAAAASSGADPIYIYRYYI